jgi:hypothetical protein
MTQLGFDHEGFEIEFKDFVTLKDGRAIVVEGVPHCIHPETREEFLHASVYEQVWDIIYQPSSEPIRQFVGDVFAYKRGSTHAQT